jgi:hypothetical protein
LAAHAEKKINLKIKTRFFAGNGKKNKPKHVDKAIIL